VTRHRIKAFVPLALIGALTAAGCNGNSSSSAPTPTTPTQTTETFSGTVALKGSAAHNFNVSASGTVTVTLTAASPPDSVVMGVGIGTPTGSSCALLTGASVNTAAGTTAQLSGLVTGGALCVQVYDVGSQTSAVAYTVTVVHP
jgi:hypothetical protein